MPSLGTTLKNGPRYNVVDVKLWKKYVKASGNNISYATFKNVIVKSNDLIRTKVLDNVSGYKMSESLGYIAVKRYKPSPGTKSIDFNKSKIHGVKIYHTNFHSYGYTGRIVWFTAKLSTCKYINLYKFIPDRDFQRGLAKRILAGKIYNEFGYDHFKARKIRVNLNRL